MGNPMRALHQFALSLALCAAALAQHPSRGVMGVMFDVKQKTPGVTLRHVAAGSPGETAGLRPGDVVMRVDDLPAVPDALSQYIASKPAGSQVTVVYLRGGKRLTTSVTLADVRATYQRSAALNDAEAEVVLGRMHLEEKDRPGACQWFRRAAEAGNAQGQTALAWCYENGVAPLPKDLAQMAHWYRRAAEQDDASGQVGLALAYGKGQGVPRDDALAMHWAKRSAEQQNAGAMVLLAELYRLGAGVPADPAEAARWFIRARQAAGADDFRKYSEEQLAAIVASGTLKRAQLDLIERDEAARAEAGREAARIKTASLHLTTHPGGAGAYVDDVFRGATSESGSLLIEGLAPGVRRLRLSREGHKQSEQVVTVGAGTITPVEVALERAGPKPLTAGDVEEALRNGVSNARLRAMVREYGVDFDLTDEAERRLRAAGADDVLLLAVSKGKRS